MAHEQACRMQPYAVCRFESMYRTHPVLSLVGGRSGVSTTSILCFFVLLPTSLLLPLHLLSIVTCCTIACSETTTRSRKRNDTAANASNLSHSPIRPLGPIWLPPSHNPDPPLAPAFTASDTRSQIQEKQTQDSTRPAGPAGPADASEYSLKDKKHRPSQHTACKAGTTV